MPKILITYFLYNCLILSSKTISQGNNMESISSLFYSCLLRWYFLPKKLQSQNLTIVKLLKARSYDKLLRKMLVKLTHDGYWQQSASGILTNPILEKEVIFNFINILQVRHLFVQNIVKDRLIQSVYLSPSQIVKLLFWVRKHQTETTYVKATPSNLALNITKKNYFNQLLDIIARIWTPLIYNVKVSRAAFFCTYSLCSYFYCKIILLKKLFVKSWWNSEPY